MFVNEMRSLYFNKYRSFYFLLTIVKQSLFFHFQSHDHVDFAQIFAFPAARNIPLFFSKAAHSESLPTEMLIKLRRPTLDLLRLLAVQFKCDPWVFSDIESMEEIPESSNFHQLKTQMSVISGELLGELILKYAGILGPIFERYSKEPVAPPAKKRGARLVEMGNSSQWIEILEKIICKVFMSIPDGSACEFRVSGAAHFDPKRAIIETLEDEENENDTAIAYQLLKEQEKTVAAADWLRAFEAKQGIRDDAAGLARFQVAVSELEYLGFVARSNRKKGTFRKILRVQ
jgi:hypothetical protein